MVVRFLVAVLLGGSVLSGFNAGAPLALFAAPTAQSVSNPLAGADWELVLRTDPQLLPCEDLPSVPEVGPCVAAPTTISRYVSGVQEYPSRFEGYADLAAIIYHDLDGDLVAEAVIPTTSLASGGSFGFLIYRAAPEPVLAVVYPGYKLSVRVSDGGELVVGEPLYFGFEANCCPTGYVTTFSRLNGTELPTTRPPAYDLYDVVNGGIDSISFSGSRAAIGAAELTVAGFYRAINERRHDVAWSLLSDGQRSRQGSFDTFAAGFAGTRFLHAALSAGAVRGAVNVTITTGEAGADGSIVNRRFTGLWLLVEDETLPLGLSLDQATIEEVDR